MNTNKIERSVEEDIALIVMVCLLIGMLCTFVMAGGKKSITIKGSDTMVHLVSNWAEAFMKEDPDVEVAVTGGGSGTGIAALINGTTEICVFERHEGKRKAAGQGKRH
jgi:ABC-type phosphate transport system substrate-binding protein